MTPLNTKKLALLFIIIASATFSKAQTLLHYWNFNVTTDIPTHLTPTSTIGGANLAYMLGTSGLSAIDVAGGTGQNFNVLNLNSRNGDVSGNHLRFNEPIGGYLIFSIPTTGYENVVFKYATRRSGSGAGTQIIEYSTDGNNYSSFTTIDPANGDPTLQTLDFSSLPATDNNSNFKIKITFIQGPGGTVGNNRFDNVTLEGVTFGTGDNVAPVATFSPLNSATNVAVNTVPTISFNEAIRLVNNTAIDNTNVDGLIVFKQTNASGTDVAFDATISGNVITITPSAALNNSQVYYLALKDNVVEDLSDNAITPAQSVTFTTISPQTIFQPGDLVFVAYRMNASDADDEIAFLTLIDIIPGTMINFTDAKYTTNATPQCSGGFTWTSPATCIPAGTVITIKPSDNFGASAGTVTGSDFGLSSNGDQVIVYTGSAASPSYITALTSKGWETANTSCSGSNSLIPATLVDGTSALNTSTTPGNTSGNTVNAFYNGTMSGSYSTLRTAILNPANWIGTGEDTPAQTWPTWNFPGPPAVVGIKIVNATTIKIGFSRDMETSSVTNIANYTGIANLTSATQTSNGTVADTITLTFSVPFTNGNSYTLNISGVKDTDNNTMSCNYSTSFNYNTTIAFDDDFIYVEEDAGTINIVLNLNYPGTASVDLVLKSAPFSTASSSDITFTPVTQTLNFTGASNSTQIISIPVVNDNTSESDEYFVLYLQNAVNCAISGDAYTTVYIIDNDRIAPTATQTIELDYVTSYDPSVGSSTTEIVVHDPVSQRLFAISAIEDRLDIINFSNPAAPSLVTSVDMTPYGGITSVAVKNGIVAVASPNANEQLDGSVVFFNTNGTFQKQVTVGALPDMVTFSPDGMKVLTANEGQPNDAYTVDPEGSVSVIDISGGISGLTQANVTTINFTSFNATESTLIASGVRKLKASSTLSQDFEPEYITISGSTAWVTLQENNAIAEINLTNNTVTSIWAMGTKDWSVDGNCLDASDNNGVVLLSNWPVKSFYIPDGIANYTVGGTTYLVTANEGDEKEYSGLNERTTIGAANLDATAYPNAAVLKESFNLGRLRMTNLNGDTDNDGDFDQIYTNGTRSFSIWNASTHAKVYDSGEDFERITSTDPSISSLFNCDNESNAFKSRSRAKGPEPEGLTIATIAGKVYAFVGLERVGGVMVYDITDPTAPVYVDYKNSRSLVAYTGDHGPEGIIYISGTNSPDGKHYVVVANELSGTLSIYEVTGTLSTGVEDEQQSVKTFTVFPNPANDVLYMNIPSSYEILDVTGKVVLSGMETSYVDVSTLDRGMYLLRAANGEVRKFMVE